MLLVSGESGGDFLATVCTAAKRSGDHTKVATKHRTHMADRADRLAELAQIASGAFDRGKDMTQITKIR